MPLGTIGGVGDQTTLTLFGLAAGAGVYAAKKGTDVVAELVGAVLKPTAEDRGAALREYFEKRRERAAAVVRSAGKLLDDNSVVPVEVPGRILFPLLEAASLKEDETLRRMWVTLLAGAGDPKTSSHILPSFVSILRDLSPAEALVLNALYEGDIFAHSRIDYEADGLGAHFNPRTVAIKSDDPSRPPTTVAMPFGNFACLRTTWPGWASSLARSGRMVSTATWSLVHSDTRS